MAGIVECVPNFSEGRDTQVVEKIVAAMTSVAGVKLLDHSMDAGHNRAVVSVFGPPDAVAEAAFRGVAEAANVIDLRNHHGEHPRMGAADVVPFIPVKGVSMEECILLAKRVGERIGNELGIPVYLYEEAATRPERENLADVRAPQFEGLRDLIGADPARDPDFGPRAIHPSAGAVAVGARHLLVAYNVYLNTSDQSIAREIAKAVRNRSGGLRYVKALGIAANEQGRVHVSMNLTNTDGTPIHRVVEMIRSEAGRYGVSVAESEVVGLVSSDVLFDAAEHYLQLNSFSRTQVLENHLLEMISSGDEESKPAVAAIGSTQPTAKTSDSSEPAAVMIDSKVRDFSGRVASADAVPGGGSVSALVGALGTSLVAMVAKLTMGRKRFEDRERRMKQVESRAEQLRAQLLDLVQADSEAYLEFMEAYRKVKAGDESARPALEEGALKAARVPLQTARASLEAMLLAREVCESGNPVARTDACVAALTAHAAVLGGCLNIRANLPSLTPEQHPEEMEAEATTLERRASTLLSEVLAVGKG